MMGCRKTVTFVKRGEIGDIFTARRVARDARGTLFECGCLDVNFERKGASSRREERERERANWNSAGQVGLSGFGRDHWGGDVGSWYQDQWWDSGTWREESEAKGSGGVEKRWRGSRGTLQSDDGGLLKGEGGYSGSENEGNQKDEFLTGVKRKRQWLLLKILKRFRRR